MKILKLFGKIDYHKEYNCKSGRLLDRYASEYVS
jgi:hypothetical protein